MQHGALVEERMAGGGLRYRRPDAAPDAFAATRGAAICEDPEDDDLMPSRSLQPAKENGCKVFLPVRAPAFVCPADATVHAAAADHM